MEHNDDQAETLMLSETTGNIERVEASNELLKVWLHGTDQPFQLPWFSIKDHSRDFQSFDSETEQRTVDSFSIDLDCSASGARVVDGSVHVEWNDSTHVSILPPELFASLAEDEPAISEWRDGLARLPLVADYRALMDDNRELAGWLESIRALGFGLASGVPISMDGAESIANRFGYVRCTVFGDMWTLSSEVRAHADSAYDTTFLEPHTDGSYANDAPGLQMFACSERTGEGGESILVDGFAAAEELRRTEPDAFELLTEVQVPSHYVEEGVSLRATRPTLRLDRVGRLAQVTFNNYDRSPFSLPAKEMRGWYEAYSAFHELVNDQSAWWVHRLEPGDLLLLDNWRCLHGRMAFTGKSVFHGCYLNREDFESRIRTLNSDH